jgi:hypothetical protein
MQQGVREPFSGENRDCLHVLVGEWHIAHERQVAVLPNYADRSSELKNSVRAGINESQVDFGLRKSVIEISPRVGFH